MASKKILLIFAVFVNFSALCCGKTISDIFERAIKFNATITINGSFWISDDDIRAENLRYVVPRFAVNWSNARKTCASDGSGTTELAAFSTDIASKFGLVAKTLEDDFITTEVWLGGTIKETDDCLQNPNTIECWYWRVHSLEVPMKEADLSWKVFGDNGEETQEPGVPLKFHDLGRTASRSSRLVLLKVGTTWGFSFADEAHGFRFICDKKAVSVTTTKPPCHCYGIDPKLCRC